VIQSPSGGIYEFEIEATKLKKSSGRGAPKSGAPFLTIEVSSSALKIISRTKDASFVISPSVPLLQCARSLRSIRFEVDRELMMNILAKPGMVPFSSLNLRLPLTELVFTLMV